MQYRIGKSTDIHQLIANRKCVIGGININAPIGPLGHSDGDLLLHAIAEAILGALGLYDLGTYFKDDDPNTLNLDSKIILGKVIEMMEEKGYCINNIDTMIIIENIKMKPYIDDMKKVIASICKCSIDDVAIKATCMEKMGFVGEEKGAIAEAIVMIKHD